MKKNHCCFLKCITQRKSHNNLYATLNVALIKEFSNSIGREDKAKQHDKNDCITFLLSSSKKNKPIYKLLLLKNSAI